MKREASKERANRTPKGSPSAAAARAAEISRCIAILHKWGVHTLGQLAALEPDQLGARLGPVAVKLWEQANGRTTRLLHLVRPTEIFAEEIEFEHEIETTEPLLFVLRRFLGQLTLRLGVLYLVAQEIRLRLTFSDPPKIRHRSAIGRMRPTGEMDSSDWRNGFTGANKSRYEHCFHIPDPTSSVDILFRLLQAHLETFRAERPIVAVGLEARPAHPTKQQFHLFETPLRDPSRLHETLTRLTGLLGRERVGRPVREDSHRPDAFWVEPFAWELFSSPNESAPMRGPALRRLRMKVLRVLDAPAVAQQGPYLASGDWWDGKKWGRAEWNLELADGRICRCQEGSGEWECEGVYD